MRALRYVARALIVALLGLSLGAPPARAAVDVYITPGEHSVDGRQWRTSCEVYSQVERCTALIYATQVKQDAAGRFIVTTGWVFNNLTYTQSPRQLWYGNPLGDVRDGVAVVGGGMSKRWVDGAGRRWRTDCDTQVTGRNGCRTYVTANVIQPYTTSTGSTAYRWVTVEVFNNMVRFGGALLSSIKDPALRACVRENVSLRGEVIPAEEILALRYLDCSKRGITSLAGLPSFPNLRELYLHDNAITTLWGVPQLPSLTWLGLRGNRLDSVAGLPTLVSLTELDLSRNQLTTLTGWPKLPNLLELDLTGNRLRNLLGLGGGQLARLVQLKLAGNALTSVNDLPSLPALTRLYVNDNRLATFDAAPVNAPALERLWLQRQATPEGQPTLTSFLSLRPWTQLEYLYVADNAVEDLAPLADLQASGCWIDVLEDNPISTAGAPA